MLTRWMKTTTIVVCVTAGCAFANQAVFAFGSGSTDASSTDPGTVPDTSSCIDYCDASVDGTDPGLVDTVAFKPCTVETARGGGSYNIAAGAAPDANEKKAGQGLKAVGYGVTAKAVVNNVAGLRSADLDVSGVGSVDVYTPQTASADSILSAIQKKSDQAVGVLTQTDLSAIDVSNIAARLWGGASAKNVVVLWFQNNSGVIIRCDR